jgi:F0F1-type ATP synthase membrane subunit b/b'
MDPQTVTQLVASLGANGLVACLFYYVITTTLPKLVDQFRAETKDTRDEAKRERDVYVAEAKAQRDHHAAQVDRLCSAIEGCGLKRN